MTKSHGWQGQAFVETTQLVGTARPGFHSGPLHLQIFWAPFVLLCGPQATIQQDTFGFMVSLQLHFSVITEGPEMAPPEK